MTSIICEILPASFGDCFLVQCTGKQKTNILIDAGFSQTYEKFLKERLLQLSKKGEYLSLFIVTHIDADHIAGGLKFLKENEGVKQANIINIEEIWHNSYKHLQFKKRVFGNLKGSERYN